MKSVLIEGGANIIQSVLHQELAQQLVLYIRPCFFGGYRSMTQQLLHPQGLADINIASVDGDIVMYGKFENYLKYISFKHHENIDKSDNNNNVNDDDNNTKSDDFINTNNTLNNINSTTNVVVKKRNSTMLGTDLHHYNKRNLVKFINVLN